ncbi:alpha/beta-hydrolase [Neurospora crassa]|uniref:Proline iminopeptidase n=1 Tax=Neurospora crassa (strain ATCC 24698 / 74-OR23-1A / CBS 708.71 / DSM 1257 / FGSC 987) TaxID=367110 RepID=Q7S1F8_NEUCR|nr:proline iminopeptidase [Neurospora crassa OR74A]EAA29180.1 proline iminopeptidase [Neurospora crassa OR74A]KHE82609.1 alpha/beta-hydrolase [Neurospora crassa]|eukprot:XP_958416.1 proline iminopeptidase [Neurospora crassa OR74A]
MMAAQVIRPARLLNRTAHIVPGQLRVTELTFEVPLNHSNLSAGNLKIFGRQVTKHDTPIVPRTDSELEEYHRRPYLVYLEGGPGFGNREPQDHQLTKTALDRGYTLLLLDYRGTGLSTPINQPHLATLGGPQQQADYLKRFRADSIVQDAEAVRLCLTADYPETHKKWSIFGQSYGGFVALTYLSQFPQGLREVFLTGGLAPVKRTAQEVYTALYKKVIQRNEAYYRKFPEDVGRVRKVAQYLDEKSPRLPGGGQFTVERLLGIGLCMGMNGGLDLIHSTILKLAMDIEQFGFITRAAGAAFEGLIPFDTNPIYAVLHESIYVNGPGLASDWAAHRVGKTLAESEPGLSWLSSVPQALDYSSSSSSSTNQQPLYFSGEMVYPAHFDCYPELKDMKETAELLAKHDDWPRLYDLDQLARNEVPVYAASYVEDMYVDADFARETAKAVRGTKVFETNVMYHGALRAKTDEVLGQLFKLRDDTLD